MGDDGIIDIRVGNDFTAKTIVEEGESVALMMAAIQKTKISDPKAAGSVSQIFTEVSINVSPTKSIAERIGHIMVAKDIIAEDVRLAYLALAGIKPEVSRRNFKEISLAATNIYRTGRFDVYVNGIHEKIISLITNTQITPEKAFQIYQSMQALGSTDTVGAIYASVDADIASKLEVNVSNLPFTFSAFSKMPGVVLPTIDQLTELNKNILSGGEGFVFCCPSYARKQSSDGSWEYTMDGLGTDIGLTAEKSLPVVVKTVEKLLTMGAKVNTTINIAIADFEATSENTQMVGLNSIAEFQDRLTSSLQSMLSIVYGQFAGSNYQTNIVDFDSLKGGSLAITNTQNGNTVNINFNGITHLLRANEYFNNLVEESRDELVNLVLHNENFRARIDKLITVRLPLFVKWSSPDEPEAIRQWRDSNLTKEQMLDNILLGMANNDPIIVEAVNYLRKRIASQGAEYSVMRELIRTRFPNAYQIISDAMGMWQVFGEHIPYVQIVGQYAGSDSINGEK